MFQRISCLTATALKRSPVRSYLDLTGTLYTLQKWHNVKLKNVIPFLFNAKKSCKFLSTVSKLADICSKAPKKDLTH